MSFDVYMKIEGIPGSCKEKNHKDYSDVRGFEHPLQYPYDMRAGKGTAEPEHGALAVIKEIDKASPLLYEACAKKKKIKAVQIEWWRDKPGGGGSEHYFTHIIEDVRVVHVKPYISRPDSNEPTHAEEVGFSYQNIKWEWLSGGKIPTEFDFSDPTA